MTIDGHRFVGSGEDWMRSQERRMIRQERRPAPPNVMDYFGPGITQNARQIADWNDVETLRNGWYFTEMLGINSPDPLKMWMGQTIVTPGGAGTQSVWSHTGSGAPVNFVRQFDYPANQSVPNFTAWASSYSNTVPTLQILNRTSTYNGGGIFASNNGVLIVRYTFTLTKIAGAQEWRIGFFTNANAAHSAGGAAGIWELRFIDHTGSIAVLQDMRVHNHAQPAGNLGCAFTSTVDVRSVPAAGVCSIEVWLNVDAGGLGFNLSPGNFSVQQVTY